MAVSGRVVETRLLELGRREVARDSSAVGPRCSHAGSLRSGSSHRFDCLNHSMLRHSSRNLPLKLSFDAVLPGLPGSMSAVSMFACVSQRRIARGHELRAVVGSQIRRRAVNADKLREHLDDPAGADAAGDIDRQALPRELIDHRQALQLLAVGAGVEHEVVGPDLIRARCGGNGPRPARSRSRRRGRFRGTCSPAWRQSRCARSALIACPWRSRNTWMRR